MSPGSKNDRYDIVIVGAGIIGLMTARELAEAGYDVALIDGNPPGATSRVNAGMLVPSYCRALANPASVAEGVKSVFTRDALQGLGPLGPSLIGWLAQFVWAARPGRAEAIGRKLLPAAKSAHCAYQDLADETEVRIGVQRCGWAHVSRADSALRAARARSLVDIDLWSRDELAQRIPGIDSRLAGALFSPGDSSLDPAATCHAALVSCRKRGVSILRARVNTVERARSEFDVVTSAGKVRATSVIVAAGARRRSIAHQPGWGWSIDVPRSSESPSVPLLDLDQHIVVHSLSDRMRITGGMRIGGRVNSQAHAAAVADLRTAAQRLLPELAIPNSAPVHIGARPMTPNGLPRVRRSRISAIIVDGHGALGMTLAPATAREVVAMVRNEETSD